MRFRKVLLNHRQGRIEHEGRPESIQHGVCEEERGQRRDVGRDDHAAHTEEQTEEEEEHGRHVSLQNHLQPAEKPIVGQGQSGDQG